MKHPKYIGSLLFAGSLLFSGSAILSAQEANQVTIGIESVEVLPSEEEDSIDSAVPDAKAKLKAKLKAKATAATEKETETEIETETETQAKTQTETETESETQTETETESETQTETKTESETQTETETETETISEAQTETEIETESETETETETESEAPEVAMIPQGIYEISSILAPELVLDVTHCLEQETDFRELQLYAPLDVNQQKFYIENLPGEFWRISAVHSGEALTADSDGSLSLEELKRPEASGMIDIQKFTFRKAGNAVFYIQASSGQYLTLADGTACDNVKVILADFTGAKTQQWTLENSWISNTDNAETDISNPYKEGGKYSNFSLTVDIPGSQETLTAQAMAENCILENHTYTFDPACITAFMEELSSKYDTLNQERKFLTSDGREISIKAGNYGWCLDAESMLASMKEHLTENKEITIEPVWTSTGYTEEFDADALNDFGDSYIEVDLGNQRVYLYKDGKKIVETECVSGLETAADRITPEGVYAIYFMDSPRILRGADYESYVDYWMAFFGGYGLHDANWRSEFGGDIWKTNGSHGCINLPIPDAKTIYENVEYGFPVILYY